MIIQISNQIEFMIPHGCHNECLLSHDIQAFLRARISKLRFVYQVVHSVLRLMAPQLTGRRNCQTRHGADEG